MNMLQWCGEAPAKINLSLDVLERLPNGYHRLAMLMQTVGLTDTITLTLRPAGISLRCVSEGTDSLGSTDIPADARNLAWKAAAAYLSQVPGLGVDIHLVKRIPAAAGLAGGSADAAAVLRGLNALHGDLLSSDELVRMGVKIGADVPYCLFGGTCLAEGIGEELTPLPSFAGHWIVLVKPPFPVSTPWVFGQLKLHDLGERPDTTRLVEAVRSGDAAGVAAGMRNVLERVTEPVHPEIAALRKQLLALGALGSRMSGSGPTVFGLFSDRETAVAAHTAISLAWPSSWVVRTVNGTD